MANEQNIIPHQFTSAQDREEAAKNGRKGGVASGAARRAKRDAREAAARILSYTPDLPESVLSTMRRMGLKGRVKPDMREIATLALAQKAMKGDLQCYKFLAEMAGETAEAAIMDARADEVLRRSGVPENGLNVYEPEGIRQRMAEMTDEELEQYERLCAKFETTAEDDAE